MVTHQLALTPILDFFSSSEVATTWQTDSTAHKLKPRLFHKSILWTSTLVWTMPDSIIRLLSLLSLLSSSVCNSTYISYFKSKMAFSHCNSLTSTLVPPLGTPFSTILHFSNHLAYLPNVPWRSRQIHQRGHSSLRSPSSTIQSGQTVLLVPSPSIVPADNDPNWEDAPINPSTNNNIANRPIPSTRS